MTDARATVPTVPGLTGLSVLARGGYATVYRAVQESIDRDVAVKVENRRLESERDQRRFLREARAAGRMSGHPNVIDLFDAGVTVSGHPYLIMELCEASYAERMKTNPLSPVEARDVGVKIADALADAHALGVLHRDVKPANLLISRFGEPQLADFGLAVLAEVRDHSVTLDVLTPAYAPPEMFRYAQPSPAGDVYSLCATLYALMWGRPPRWRDEASPSLMSLVDLFDQPIPDVPGVPPEVMRLLRAGMTNDERHRPSAVELRDALLLLDFDPGSGQVIVPSRRPVFGPPSWGPSESVSAPSGAGRAGWSSRPAGSPSGQPEYPGDDEETRRRPEPPAGHAFAGFQPGGAGFVPGGAGPAPRRPRRPRWWLGIAPVVLALVLMVTLGGWYASGHARTLPPVEPTTPAATPTGSGAGGGAPCALAGASPTMRCVAAPECFGALTVDGGVAHATTTPCDQPHAWEVFALDSLPASVTATDYQSIRTSPAVQGACNTATLATVSFSAYAWKVDVLPPGPEALKAGDRTFRCLAGPGAGTSTGSKFTRSGR